MKMPWYIKVAIGASIFSALCSGTATVLYIIEALR